jgi:hypothetical protein
MDQSLIGGAALWLALNGVAVWQLHGTWRKAALVPVAIMGLAVAIAALGVLGGSNLAPIWVVFALPVCLVLIVLVWIAKAFVMAWRSLVARP